MRLPAIPAPDLAARDRALKRLDSLTKPRGSLGRLEALAAWYAGIAGTETPATPRCTVFVIVGDHGVAARGVSAYPREVTGQMLANFVGGGAAISVLARTLDAALVVVDAGTLVAVPGTIDRRLGTGTADFTIGPAMSREQAVKAIETGINLASTLERGDVVVPGEMGIGNTTSAAALTAVFCGRAPAEVVGAGTGVDARGLAAKRVVVEEGLARNNVDRRDPLGVLAALGGFEIATLAGLIIGAAARRSAVILDGFVSTSAALAAAALAPGVVAYLQAGHLSPEPGHRIALSHLGLDELLDLGMRLGEGSGAILALPLLRAACAALSGMSTFDEAGVVR